MLPELLGELIKQGLRRGRCDREVVQALHPHRSGCGLAGGKRVEIDCADGYTTLTVLKNHWVLYFDSESVSHSVLSNSLRPRDYVHQAPLSMEFCRQEYCSGLPFPPPGESS